MPAPTPPPPASDRPEAAGKQLPLSAWLLPRGARRTTQPGEGAASDRGPREGTAKALRFLT